ncbi:hypothetical protein KC973_01330, partial [Candidatus Saccharibacteria bacterium]|nr:hypothetical protein [Candidatus Saccharibacteria bacterium]
ITWLETECPGIEPVLLDTSGETPELNRFVNIYVGPKGGSTADDIRFLGGLAARVQGDDEVTIIPAIAGGCSDTDSGVSRHIPGEEQRARADALEQRVRDGDPTLTTYILADLEEQFGVTR